MSFLYKGTLTIKIRKELHLFILTLGFFDLGFLQLGTLTLSNEWKRVLVLYAWFFAAIDLHSEKRVGNVKWRQSLLGKRGGSRGLSI